MLSIKNNNYHIPYSGVSPAHIAFGHRLKLPSFLKRDTVEISEKNIPALSDKKILKLVQSSIQNKNYIGQGSEGKVYRIKNSDFVVKIPYDTMFFIHRNFRKKFVNNADKVNHVEAKFENGITIMKLIEGKCLDTNREDYKKVAQMPTRAYNNLLKQLCNAQKLNMDFDNVSENIIANYKNNTLTAIDFIPIYQEIAEEIPFRPMIQICEAIGYKNDYYKHQTTGKTILAGLAEMYPDVVPCTKIENLDFNELLDFAKKECKTLIKKTPEQWNKLDDLLLEIKNLKTKESNDESLKSRLLIKIKKAEKIISEYFEL